MDNEKLKKYTAGLSVISNTVLIVLKLAAGIISGSMSIISEAIHSISDLLASLLTLFSVSKSCQPADKQHPFGHGKYEDMSGFIEGGLIIFASFFIVYEAAKKIFFEPQTSIDTHLGLYVMGTTVVVNILVSTVLLNVSKSSDSISLYADGQHLRTDVWSSLGVFAGMLAINYTGLYILDPIIAIFVAIIIFRTGLAISKRTMNNLLDCSLPDEDLEVISKILDKFKENEISDYKDLKARRLGSQKKIEVTLTFSPDMTINQCHQICDRVEHEFSKHFPNVKSSIHLEPQSEVIAKK